MKKIFIFSEIIPYPLTNGGAIAQFFFLEKLSLQFEFTYCTIIKTEEQKKNIQDLNKTIPELNIDYFEASIQTGWQTKLEKILRSTFSFFERRIKSLLKIQEYNNLDPTSKLNNVKFYDRELIDFLNDRLTRTKFDFVQLEFFESISLLSIFPPDMTKIFIHHEIRFKRLALSDSKPDKYNEYFQKTLTQIELSLLNLSDKVVVFNKDDADLLKHLKPEIIVSSFGIPERMIVKNSTSTRFERFIFTGPSGHYPNQEGITWFLDTIYVPFYDKINFPVYIIGNWNKSIKVKYRKYKKIVFTGFVNDIKEYFENSVFLSPILSGSGIRTKILEAFANKIPVISTKFGSEGLYNDGENIEHILHFETKDDFMGIYNKIHKHPKFLSEVANNGYLYYSKTFSKEILLTKRASIYQ